MFYLTAGQFASFYTKALLTQSGSIRNTISKRTQICLILTLAGVDYICAKFERTIEGILDELEYRKRA
jgi:hypothetical protein